MRNFLVLLTFQRQEGPAERVMPQIVIQTAIFGCNLATQESKNFGGGILKRGKLQDWIFKNL